jgi:Ca2+-transporting ATPase
MITGCLSGLKKWTARILVAAAVASLVLLVQVPMLARLVHLTPLDLADWAIAVVAGVASGGLSPLLVFRGHERQHGTA